MSRQLNHSLNLVAGVSLEDFMVPKAERLEAGGAESVSEVLLAPPMQRPLLVAATA